MDNSIYLSIRYSLTRIKQSTDALVLSAMLWIMEIEILLTLAYTFMELVLRNQELFKYLIGYQKPYGPYATEITYPLADFLTPIFFSSSIDSV